MAASLSPMRIVTFRMLGGNPAECEAAQLYSDRLRLSSERRCLPFAFRDDGPNLSISVSPGGESKRGARSSGERKGRSRARG